MLEIISGSFVFGFSIAVVMILFLFVIIASIMGLIKMVRLTKQFKEMEQYIQSVENGQVEVNNDSCRERERIENSIDSRADVLYNRIKNDFALK